MLPGVGIGSGEEPMVGRRETVGERRLERSPGVALGLVAPDARVAHQLVGVLVHGPGEVVVELGLRHGARRDPRHPGGH